MRNLEGESDRGLLRAFFDRRLKFEFHGSRITSDAGLLAYRELDEALGLTTLAGDVIADSRTGKNGWHGIIGLLRQSVYGRLAGYEDVNGCERIEHVGLHGCKAGWAKPMWRIYGDFSGTRLAGWNKQIQSLAILQHQQRSNTTGKNAADIALVIDAMDLMHKGTGRSLDTVLQWGSSRPVLPVTVTVAP